MGPRAAARSKIEIIQLDSDTRSLSAGNYTAYIYKFLLAGSKIVIIQLDADTCNIDGFIIHVIVHLNIY
jgi:hypothetical protein